MSAEEVVEKIRLLLLESGMEGFVILTDPSDSEHLFSAESLVNGTMDSRGIVPTLYGICYGLLEGGNKEGCQEVIQSAVKHGFYVDFEEERLQ